MRARVHTQKLLQRETLCISIAELTPAVPRLPELVHHIFVDLSISPSFGTVGDLKESFLGE